jgi:hypothetical protein
MNRNKIFAAAGVLAASAAVALGTGAASFAASAPATAGTSYTAVTQMTSRPDSGGNGNWATDNFTRTATVQVLGQAEPSACGESSGPCYAMSASLSDQGTFKTIHLAYAPNQGAPYTGEKIGAVVHGTMHGYGTFPEFYVPVLPRTSLVPSQVTGSADPSYTWPQLFFPAGTTLTGLNEANFGYFYHTVGIHPKLQQNWSDADFNGSGQQLVAGKITK